MTSNLWYMDSRDRSMGTNEDFYVSLRHRVNDLKAITVRQIEVPFSWYVFTANHVINFNEGGGELSATLTAGNYTSTELIAHLKAIMDAVGGQVYTWAYNAITGKLTVSAPGAFTLMWATGTNTGNGIDELLGFTQAGGTPADSVAGVSHTAGSVLNTSGENALYLELTPFSPRDIMAMPNLNNNPKQILCKIPVTVSPGGIISYSPEPYSLRVRGDLDQVRFRLIDRRSNSVSLNGREMSFTIELSY